MVGSATFNEFKNKSNQLLFVDRKILDLKNEEKVLKWFKDNKPQSCHLDHIDLLVEAK